MNFPRGNKPLPECDLIMFPELAETEPWLVINTNLPRLEIRAPPASHPATTGGNNKHRHTILHCLTLSLCTLHCSFTLHALRCTVCSLAVIHKTAEELAKHDMTSYKTRINNPILEIS